MYHSTHIHMYNGFFKKEESKGMAVEQIIELTSHKEIYPELRLYMSFIKESCSCLMSSLTSLEATRDPLACTVYNTIQHHTRRIESLLTLWNNQDILWYRDRCPQAGKATEGAESHHKDLPCCLPGCLLQAGGLY